MAKYPNKQGPGGRRGGLRREISCKEKSIEGVPAGRGEKEDPARQLREPFSWPKGKKRCKGEVPTSLPKKGGKLERTELLACKKSCWGE